LTDPKEVRIGMYRKIGSRHYEIHLNDDLDTMSNYKLVKKDEF